MRRILFLVIALFELSIGISCTNARSGKMQPFPKESLSDTSEVPDGVIPFILDGHLYLKAVLNDSLPVSLVYDTGADFLYLDKDYLRTNGSGNSFGTTKKMRMGGAGNGDPNYVDVIVNPIGIRLGKHMQRSKIAPIINLREILGRHADGLLGNRNFVSNPLCVSFSKGYLLPLDSIPVDMLAGYTQLKAVYSNKRIFVEATLTLDSSNIVNGLFLLDMGCGSSIILTNDTYSGLDLSFRSKALFHTQAGGVGGASDEVQVRADNFVLCDTLQNLVVQCSLNSRGALSKREYVGLIGTEILSLFDIVFDPQNQLVYLKRVSNSQDYAKASTVQMSFYDRTDICEGWIVNGLHKGGIAERSGIEIGDIILSINGRAVKDISWEEQRNLKLEGRTIFLVKKKDGSAKEYTLHINKQVI